jgi:hypothetical protein
LGAAPPDRRSTASLDLGRLIRMWLGDRIRRWLGRGRE